MADPATGQPEGPTPLPLDGVGSRTWWQTQVTASDDKIATKKVAWQRNLDAYLVQKQTAKVGDTVYVPLDFANVEQKKALLYFKNPDMQLTAAPGHEASADAVQAFQVVLNETLGPDGVDAETMMDEMLMDVLCPSGIGVTVIGLDITTDGTEQIQTGTKPGPPIPGQVLGLQPASEVPVYTAVPKVIHQSYFWERLSPLDLILPSRWTGSNFDKAPYLGYHFELDRAGAVRTLGLTPAEAVQASGSQPSRLNSVEETTGKDSDVIRGVCLFYRGCLYNPDVKHPEEIWRLMWVDGVDRILKHDRPYQQVAPDGTIIGLMGNPVCVYTPRYVSDTAFPPSDCSMSRHQVDEISEGRSQMVMQRKRSRPMRELNINGLQDPKQKDAIERGEWQEIILKTSSEPLVTESARATYPRENFEFNNVSEKDVQRVWKLGDGDLGVQENTRRTATELSLRKSGSNTSLSKERNRLAKWYSKSAQKLGGLVQLFEDQRTTVAILGPQGEQKLQAWDLAALPMRFVCTAKPNTMIQQDAEGEFRQTLDVYQMTANDPHANRVELLKILFRHANLDPTLLITPQLPPRTPEPPRISLAISGIDLNPAMPQFPIIQQMLSEGGVTIDPANIQTGLDLHMKNMAMQPAGTGALVAGKPSPNAAHGGAAQKQEPLNQHASEGTGMLPGGGADKAQAVN